jgi:hypothetical protein
MPETIVLEKDRASLRQPIVLTASNKAAINREFFSDRIYSPALIPSDHGAMSRTEHPELDHTVHRPIPDLHPYNWGFRYSTPIYVAPDHQPTLFKHDSHPSEKMLIRTYPSSTDHKHAGAIAGPERGRLHPGICPTYLVMGHKGLVRQVPLPTTTLSTIPDLSWLCRLGCNA